MVDQDFWDEEERVMNALMRGEKPWGSGAFSMMSPTLVEEVARPEPATRRRTRSETSSKEAPVRHADADPVPPPVVEKPTSGKTFATPRERLAWYRELGTFDLRLVDGKNYVVIPRNNSVKGRRSFANRFGRDLRSMRFLPPQSDTNASSQWIRPLLNPLSGEPEPIDTHTLRTEAQELADEASKRKRAYDPFARVQIKK